MVFSGLSSKIMLPFRRVGKRRPGSELMKLTSVQGWTRRDYLWRHMFQLDGRSHFLQLAEEGKITFLFPSIIRHATIDHSTMTNETFLRTKFL